DVIRAMTTGQFLDFLGIRLDSIAAEGERFSINLITPDTGETYAVELSNATLTNLEGFLVDGADLTITVDRSALEEAMIGATTLQQLVADGAARLEGDPDVLPRLASLLVHFEVGFEIMPGTGSADGGSPLADFEQEPLGDTAGG
ncbi:MAG: alkyl sulfatase C-terminal domain-containing protein, partial [Propionicimonas sp.]